MLRYTLTPRPLLRKWLQSWVPRKKVEPYPETIPVEIITVFLRRPTKNLNLPTFEPRLTTFRYVKRPQTSTDS